MIGWHRVHGVVGVLAVLACVPARAASYSEARDAFDAFSLERRLTAQVLLNASGYSLVVPTTNLSQGVYEAIRAFEAQHGFAAQGLLDERQLAALAVAAAPSLKLWGFRTITYPGRTMTIWVPAGLGLVASEDAAGRHFRDRDGRLSIDMVSSTGRDVQRVHDEVVAGCAARGAPVGHDDYHEGDQWFAVSCGGADGRERLARFHEDDARVTGFVLEWRADADTFAAGRLAAIMSGSLRSAVLGQPFPAPPTFVVGPASALEPDAR